MPHVLNLLKINGKLDSVIFLPSKNRKYNNTILLNERFDGMKGKTIYTIKNIMTLIFKIVVEKKKIEKNKPPSK